MCYLPHRRFPRALVTTNPMKFRVASVFTTGSSCAHVRNSALLIIASLGLLPVNGQDRCPDPNPLASGRSYNLTAASEFGQPRLNPLTSHNPNYVEGREFFAPYSVALDLSSNPHRIYVADTANNRVLAWNDSNGFTRGDAADKVIGQRDMISTDPQTPSGDYPSGLYAPVAVLVDPSGNLYVVDAGNNRILRYPSPFTRADFATPDLIIGQRTLRSGNSANEGLRSPDQKTIYLSPGSGVQLSSGLAMDRGGNLWFVDAGNNRVLRYPQSALTANTQEPQADIVVGQGSWTTNAIASNNARWNKASLPQPTGIAVSDGGDLYVGDAYGRVMYYQAPITNFRVNADRILGMPSPTTANPNPNAYNGCPPNGSKDNCDYALGADLGGGRTSSPGGLALFGNSLFVADSGNNRVVRYGSPDTWEPVCNFDGTAASICSGNQRISPRPIQFIGQGNDGSIVAGNRGQRQPDATSLLNPQAVALAETGELYVADTGNNRVLALSAQTQYSSATRVLGQTDFQSGAPNMADGRGLWLARQLQSGTAIGVGIAVDSTSNPPHLYVADTFNNRVLAFEDARKVRPGSVADRVIGQPNFVSTTINYGSTSDSVPTASSLSAPTGVIVDADGNLWVADTGNSRVIRFAKPFSQPGVITASRVLGQTGFSVNPANAPALGASSMAAGAPYGLALTQNGSLLVSDASANRVLLFRRPAGADFTDGQAATAVFGQPSFNSFAAGSETTQMNFPHGIAVDSSDRLYVADTGNQRILAFGFSVSSVTTNPRASFSSGLGDPFSMAISSTGEIWVTTRQGTVRFPFFEIWSLNPTQTLQIIPPSDSSSPPVGVALDAFDNPIVAEASNRLALYYTRATFANAASFLSTSVRPLAPGMLAYMCGAGIGIPTTSSLTVVPGMPWPTTWSDTQVIVNGVAAPLYYVNPDRVAFQVPSGTPVGTVDVQMIRASTGQIIASANIPIDVTNPGFFVTDADPATQPSRPTDPHVIAATNQDGTVNSQANPVGRGQFIALYGTGVGVLSNPPADGRGAVVGAPLNPIVAMNPGGAVPAGNVTYFGLVDWAPGVFQLNVKVPDTVANSGSPPWQVQVAFNYQGKPTNQTDSGQLLRTIIWVK